LPGRQVSLILARGLPTIPSPITWHPAVVALSRYPSAPRLPRFIGVRLRPRYAGSSGCPAESSSSSYGLVIHLLLLPTPPLGDAVAFSFRPESVCLKRTSTSLTSRALRRTYHRLPVDGVSGPA